MFRVQGIELGFPSRTLLALVIWGVSLLKTNIRKKGYPYS